VLKHYITQALRSFWRFKITAIVNLAGLTVALVCFITTFLFLDGLTRNGDREYANSARTYVLTQELWTTPTNRMIPAFPQVAPGTAKYLRADLPRLEAVARGLNLGPLAAAAEDRSAYLFGLAVDPEFLKIFDFKVVKGELANALASSSGAVITEDAAKRLFGTTDVIGRAVLLQTRAEATISAVIGSTPSGSHLGDSTRAQSRFDLLVPMTFLKTLGGQNQFGVASDAEQDQWGFDAFWTYVLLPKGGSVTPDQLRETLRAFPARHIPKNDIISVFGVVPLTDVKLAMLEAFTGNRSIPLTASPFLLDALILAIACLNYANLTVAVATTRAREIGVRKVLGASQPHLMRQYLVEAALLGGAALILVLIGVALAVPALNSAFGLQFQLSSLMRPALWLLVVLLLAVISLVGGAYPAMVLSRVRPVEALRSSTVRAGPKFVPTVLVGVQFAAASFLLVVSLMMVAQNSAMQRVGLQPDKDPVVVIGNDIRQLGVPFETFRDELLRDPRIKSVSGTLQMPWGSGGTHQVVRRTQDRSSATPTAMANYVYYDFFQTAGLTRLAGRDFDREHADEFSFDPTQRKGDAKVILDRALTQQLGFSSPADAVDKTIYFAEPWNPDSPGLPVHVIGVVENGFPRLVGPNADSNMYMVMQMGAAVPLVRVSRDNIPGALERIDSVWKKLVPKAPVRRYFLDELFSQSYENFNMLSRVLGGLAGFAFVIAVMGLIGMAVHITSRRLREIGIRKTLGASASGVVMMLLRDFSKPVLIANLVAWPFAYFAGQLYFNLFTHRATLTPWPFVISLAITLAIAWLAVGTQAFRAAAVKPASVLHLD
jgi:putative ABC transport system permease protein